MPLGPAASWVLTVCAMTLVTAQEQGQIALHGLIRPRAGGGVALLRFGDGRAMAIRIGDTRSGWTLATLLRGSAILESDDGDSLEVFLSEAAPDVHCGLASMPYRSKSLHSSVEVAADEPDAFRSTSLTAHSPSGTAPVEISVRRFSSEDVRLRLAKELPRILTGVVVAPRISGNEAVGLELVSFPAETILAETGLLPGDVLLMVNGRAVRSVESIAVLVQRFQTASELEILVEREDRLVTLRVYLE